jgi:anthranilate/para-aminobenzoate synthase component I
MFNFLSRIVQSHVRPSDIFRAFFLNSINSYWLDSSRVDAGYSRCSFMGDGGGPHAHLLTQKIGAPVSVHSPSGERKVYETDIFSFLDTALAKTRITTDMPFPFDFAGGYVGYLGYELMTFTENVHGHSFELPDAFLLFSDRFIAIDHLENKIYVIALYEDDKSVAETWIDSICHRLPSIAATPAPAKAEICRPSMVENYLVHDKAQYLSNIAHCKENIEAGESYEICLTNRLRIPLRSHQVNDTFETYLVLRETNPAPYSCFLKTIDFSVLCSSPERFLKIDRQGEVEARPIKGTMPRDQNPQRDDANRDALAHDERFFSENLMIVDLLRNDLIRSCVPGTVSVPALMKVESYATVHQLVSTIRGKLESSVPKCVATCFPGGSMTGAPKKRTLEIIDEIEDMPRGIYSGAIGFLSLNASADLNIVIRTIVIHQDVAEIGVGGAITYLSDPQLEYDEMLLKALAPLSAIRMLMKDDASSALSTAGSLTLEIDGRFALASEGL